LFHFSLLLFLGLLLVPPFPDVLGHLGQGVEEQVGRLAEDAGADDIEQRLGDESEQDQRCSHGPLRRTWRKATAPITRNEDGDDNTLEYNRWRSGVLPVGQPRSLLP